ncbi:MAG: recombinase family protein [Actinomycetota bacterium]
MSGVLVENVLASISDWYSRNLSVETKKGKTQKAREGWYPSVAPIGYLNRDGKIVVDEETAPLIREAFELYASGSYTLVQLRDTLALRGLRGQRNGKPLALSRIATMLGNPFYAGRFVYAGVEYEGKHPAMISPDVVVKVRETLASHNKAGTRERKHEHELKGTLYWACGRRLCLTIAKGRFPYFFCLEKCGQPYASAETIERQVLDAYASLVLPDDTLAEIEEELAEEARNRDSHRARLSKNLGRRMDRLDSERDKLMRAYYAEAVPVELLKREQDRITEERASIEAELATLEQRLADAEDVVRLAVSLARNCRDAYLRSAPELRQEWNRAVFRRIVVQDGRVARIELAEPFASLFSHGSNKGGQRRRTGIEPACQLSPVHRFEGMSGSVAAFRPVTSAFVFRRRPRTCKDL